MKKVSKPKHVQGWLDPLPDQVTILEKLALASLTSSSRDVDLVASITTRNYERLLNWPVSEMYYKGQNVATLIETRQALAFYQKNPELPMNVDAKQRTDTKWKEAERQCCETNLRLEHFWSDKTKSPTVVRAIVHARKQIQKILGPVPAISELSLSFGPGATTNIPKKDASPSNKMGGGLNCSPGLYASKYFAEILAEIPHWLEALGLVPEFGVAMLPKVTLSYPKLAYVPKDAVSFRIVTPEPTLNSFIQLAIGKYMTRLLLRAGIDIRDQTKNQRLARLGSLTGRLATLDLSSASDTLATALIRLLLPEDWFHLLNACRSKRVHYSGLSQPLITSKFSGMGNGFIFPLETLVFWALCHSIDPSVAAYGDDIIVNTNYVDDVIQVLEFCGFSINRNKSFADPDVPFRESCGADYFNGTDIRPFYQRGPVTPETLFTLHNFYYRRYQMDQAKEVMELIPHHLRLYGPDGYGDGHLLSQQWCNTTTQKMIKKGWTGLRFDTFVHGSVTQVTRYPGDWVSPLYSIYVSNGEPLLQDSMFPKVFVAGKGFVNHGLMVNTTPVSTLADGRPKWTVPGSSGYKRVSIYSLA